MDPASRVELRMGDQALVRLVGPASRQGGAWTLPILGSLDDSSDSPTWQSQSAALRRAFGLEPVPNASPDVPRAPDARLVALTRNLLEHVLSGPAGGR